MQHSTNQSDVLLKMFLINLYKLSPSSLAQTDFSYKQCSVLLARTLETMGLSAVLIG